MPLGVKVLGAVSECYLCGDTAAKLTLDHSLPKSRGGTREIDNLRAACRSCNRLKGRWTLEEFRERCLMAVTGFGDWQFRKVHPSRIPLYERIIDHMGWA